MRINLEHCANFFIRGIIIETKICVFLNIFRIFQNGRLFYKVFFSVIFIELIRSIKIEQDNIIKKACVLIKRYVC